MVAKETPNQPEEGEHSYNGTSRKEVWQSIVKQADF